MGLAEGPFGNLCRGEETRQPATARAWVSRGAPQHGVAPAAGLQRRTRHDATDRPSPFMNACERVFFLNL